MVFVCFFLPVVFVCFVVSNKTQEIKTTNNEEGREHGDTIGADYHDYHDYDDYDDYDDYHGDTIGADHT